MSKQTLRVDVDGDRVKMTLKGVNTLESYDISTVILRFKPDEAEGIATALNLAAQHIQRKNRGL